MCKKTDRKNKIQETNERQIVVCDGNRQIILNRKNIVKINSIHIYSVVESKMKECKGEKNIIHNEMVRVSLNKWEDILKNRDFFRIGRSTIVNFEFVREIGDKILLDTGETVNIPVRNKTRVKKAYLEYCKQKGINVWRDGVGKIIW